MRYRIHRAKRTDNGQWVKGFYVERQYTTYCFTSDYLTHPDNTKGYILFDQMMDWGLPNQHYDVEVFIDTVGQNSGKLDKNNRELFEGDIVKVNSMFVPCDNNIFVVEWCSDWSGFVLRNSFTVYGFDTVDSDDVEVIGNIHDNPKLFICSGIEEESSEEIVEKR